MSDNLVNYRNIKGPDSKEREIELLLQNPGVYEKIQAVAATINDCFNAQTKVLVDLNIGGTFKDTHDGEEYIHEGVLAPYDFDAMSIVIMRAAQYPIEELQDQGYAMFRRKAIVGGERYICSLKDYVKMFSVKRWVITDFNAQNKNEIANKVF